MMGRPVQRRSLWFAGHHRLMREDIRRADSVVGRYRVIREIGRGAMGVVCLAEDTELGRKVALKFLPPSFTTDPSANSRLRREAQAASACDHPGLATIYEIGHVDDQLFIAMAYYDGETLRARLDRGALSPQDAARIGLSIAEALAAAHRAGVVHRDLKPGNVMLVDGRVKVVDFGIATSASSDAMMTRTATAMGGPIGTPLYLAPELLGGASADQRSDIWAFGVTFYEMLTGTVPFRGDTVTATLLAIAQDPLVPARTRQPAVPAELATIADRALTKLPGDRLQSFDDIVTMLSQWVNQQRDSLPPRSRWSRSVVAATVMVAVTVSVGLAWLWWTSRERDRARTEVVPEIQRLLDAGQAVAAFELAGDAKRHIPDDLIWQQLNPLLSRDVSIDTDPAGARVSYRPYGGGDGAWTEVGVSPVAHASVPNSYLEWKAEIPGRRPAIDAPVFSGSPDRAVHFDMRVPENGQVPEGMVYATTDREPYVIPIPGLEHLPPVTLQDFWIDRFEVTNRQFKRFVDAGGYTDQKYWREPFVTSSGTLVFADAVRQFTDTTGRPGPAAWEFGAYPDGEDDHPVRGVSWFEAAAYAAFVDRDLPTIYHWSLAAALRSSTYVVPKSNFAGRGPVTVGASGAMHRFGTFDFAGNVKEWCRNRADGARRYILGGAWDEPVYMFNDPDARSPFERRDNFGFRTVKYTSREALATLDREVIAFEARDYKTETPASDSVFAAYRGAYTYDPSPLNARVDKTDASSPDWVVEHVSYAAAYGGERVPALLFLPRRAKPPFQTVVYFPGSGALQARSSTLINPRSFDWILKSGRAVIHPIYKSTFERWDEVTTDYPSRSAAFRDHVLMWSKDVSRTVDYLESRADIRPDALAYMGLSWGGAMGPVFVAVEPRFKTAIFVVAGFYQQHSLPEVDALHFAPRVRVPSLMLDGKYDFFYPTATAQEPMFQLLGAPSRDKRRQVYDTGHNIPRPEMIKETADWLDRYLGPVAR